MYGEVLVKHAKEVLGAVGEDNYVTFLYGKPIGDYTKEELGRFIAGLYLEKCELQEKLMKLI